MDDYNVNVLSEAKNEYSSRLVTILTPLIIEGIRSIFNEACQLCQDNDEEEKYLMTFQNLLNNIPKWSSEIVNTEKERIESSSCCNYLEDLITCVHITQLKSLTLSRVGLKQKKVDIDIPNLNSFIHKVYINIARKTYVNVYLFEKDIMPLQIQKNNRELEIIVKECILNTIRDNIPIENILRIYLDETIETDVEVEETKEIIPDEEMIKKQAKEEKERELEKAKKEIKDKIDKENKINLSEAIKNANKSLNNTNEENLLNNNTESEIKSEIDYDSNDDYKIDSNLNLDNENDSDIELEINSLDNKDPDELDLESLNIKENNNIDLDIIELK